MSIGDILDEHGFDEVPQLLCKKESPVIGPVFGSGNGESALNWCKRKDECSSVIHDKCATIEKYELCGGLEFEETGGTAECNTAARKKCECL